MSRWLLIVVVVVACKKQPPPPVPTVQSIEVQHAVSADTAHMPTPAPVPPSAPSQLPPRAQEWFCVKGNALQPHLYDVSLLGSEATVTELSSGKTVTLPCKTAHAPFQGPDSITVNDRCEGTDLRFTHSCCGIGGDMASISTPAGKPAKYFSCFTKR